MKCPRCWSEKAYVHKATGWRRLLLPCLLLVPMRCHHCYEEFVVFWFRTLGQQVRPPQLRAVGTGVAARPSYAARHYAVHQTMHQAGAPPATSLQAQEPPRAKAA